MKYKCLICGQVFEVADGETPVCPVCKATGDKLVPYKHYASDLITGVLDGDIGPEDPMNEEYPCDETLHRWNHWFMANLFRIEGCCGLVWHHVLDPGMGSMQPGASILKTIQGSCDRWLAAILRMIYNSGGFLVSS